MFIVAYCKPAVLKPRLKYFYGWFLFSDMWGPFIPMLCDSRGYTSYINCLQQLSQTEQSNQTRLVLTKLSQHEDDKKGKKKSRNTSIYLWKTIACRDLKVLKTQVSDLIEWFYFSPELCKNNIFEILQSGSISPRKGTLNDSWTSTLDSVSNITLGCCCEKQPPVIISISRL